MGKFIFVARLGSRYRLVGSIHLTRMVSGTLIERRKSVARSKMATFPTAVGGTALLSQGGDLQNAIQICLLCRCVPKLGQTASFYHMTALATFPAPVVERI
jgi:hypothetical protein